MQLVETMVSLGIDEQLVGIQQLRPALVARAIAGARTELGADLEDEDVRVTLSSHLSAIDGGLAR